MFELPDSDGLIASALAEDLGVEPERFSALSDPTARLLEHDVTTSSVVDPGAVFTGRIVAREQCVVCGLPVMARVFEMISTAAGLFEPVEVFPLVAEGSRVEPGVAVAEIEGPAQAVLAAERTALDLVMLLSGISTQTARWVDAAGRVAVCDTRKTIPGMRELSKYAVYVGGGTNHRHGLYDMVLVKDNHLTRVGSVTEAIGRARAMHPGLLLEVEADRADQALDAVVAGADMVLLDNMNDDELARLVPRLREAAQTAGRVVELEASGNITLDRLAALDRLGIDRVSTSALTLARPVDFGLDEVPHNL